MKHMSMEEVRSRIAEANKPSRPEYVTDDMLVYLDELRESGVTNMFGAGPYVQSEFPELDREQARSVLSHWMETFSERHS